MFRFFTTVMSLLLILGVGLSSVAHAAESAGGIEIASSMTLNHVDGDRDEVPSDSEKSYPHHHSECHEHQAGVPASLAAVTPFSGKLMRAVSGNPEHLPVAVVDPALRPPIA